MSVVIQGVDCGPSVEFFSFLRDLGAEMESVTNAEDDYPLLLNIVHVQDWPEKTETKEALSQEATTALRQFPGLTDHSKWILRQLEGLDK